MTLRELLEAEAHELAESLGVTGEAEIRLIKAHLEKAALLTEQFMLQQWKEVELVKKLIAPDEKN